MAIKQSESANAKPKPKPEPSRSTQAGRRAKYGLNVALSAVLAIAIVVVINLIAFHRYARFDFTATRSHSLSEQTRTVLDQLDQDIRIVSILRSSNTYLEKTRDLLDDYARVSGNIRTEHIAADREITRLDTFYASVTDRFKQELEPLQAAIETGRETLDKLRNQTRRQAAALSGFNENADLPEGRFKSYLPEIVSALSRIETSLDAVNQEIAANLETALPDYPGARASIVEGLRQYNLRVLTIAIAELESAAAIDSNELEAEAKLKLMPIVGSLKESQKLVNETVAALSLDAVPEAEGYANLVGKLAGADNVIVMLGEKPQTADAIPAVRLFREPPPDPTGQQSNEQRELVFLGEEVITGTLVKMSLENPPMVVFMYGGRRPAFGRGGEYNVMAERLRAIGFDVQQWNPNGVPGQFGQPQPPGPAPEAADGQRVVWIITPGEPVNPNDPRAAQAQKRMSDTVAEKLQDGDSAMISLLASPGMLFGAVDPVVQTIETYGISPRLESIILKQRQVDNRQVRAETLMEVREWKDDLPITAALAGLPAAFPQTSPIVIREIEGRDDLKVYPLVEVSGPRLWAETELTQNTFRELNPDPAKQADRFIIAAAAQTPENRLIVVADPVWSSDNLTGLGVAGPGTAEIFGAAFPGNAELFINSVYWLAGLDQLIAASPRTQDIRRVGPMTTSARERLRWLLMIGLPLLIACVGYGVYLRRRA